MRRFVCAFALMLLLSSAAFAVTKEFGRFTIDVPDGWSASDEGNGTTSIMAEDKSAALTVTINDLKGATLGEVAEQMSNALGGTKPDVDADGDYSFDFSSGGVASRAVMTGDNREYMMLSITGQHEELAGILNSIEIK